MPGMGRGSRKLAGVLSPNIRDIRPHTSLIGRPGPAGTRRLFLNDRGAISFTPPPPNTPPRPPPDLTASASAADPRGAAGPPRETRTAPPPAPHTDRALRRWSRWPARSATAPARRTNTPGPLPRPGATRRLRVRGRTAGGTDGL